MTYRLLIKNDESGQPVRCDLIGDGVGFGDSKQVTSDPDSGSDSDSDGDGSVPLQSLTISWSPNRIVRCEATQITRTSKISSVNMYQGATSDLYFVVLTFKNRQHPSFKSKDDGITLKNSGSDVSTWGRFRDDICVKISFSDDDDDLLLTGGNE